MGAALLSSQSETEKKKNSHTHTHKSNKCVLIKKNWFFFLFKTAFTLKVILLFSFSLVIRILRSLSHNVHCIVYRVRNKYSQWVFCIHIAMCVHCTMNGHIRLSTPQVEFDFSYSFTFFLLSVRLCLVELLHVHSLAFYLIYFFLVRQMFEYPIKRHRYYYNNFFFVPSFLLVYDHSEHTLRSLKPKPVN